ncbi:nucleoside diphosphate kinase regulator [Myxococcus sp. RHSTA-1-4]|uniref:nucleoside diphosphate kinase regulator n=1 Tax=Myxococcus sp. RHSTA-1-4 TaxID=2874601 RepID=UPI001CBEF019|nr:nucleoside diphosphate kinase regulator [Myxococcus sp. RHSTA-1-4]MBZ4422765.1 nucleoside diphosphate kinase regulator [Myxococcus sp. RHSTA-1-4]
MKQQPRIIIARDDLDRLQRVIEKYDDERAATLADMLDRELGRAEIVPRDQLPGDVVAMNSTVLFQDEETGARRELMLCYPEDARGVEGRLSILSPIGSALLGLSIGQTIEWPVHGGRRRLTVLAVSAPPRDTAAGPRVA